MQDGTGREKLITGMFKCFETGVQTVHTGELEEAVRQFRTVIC